MTISWQQPGLPVVLASQSPRRRDILAQMGFAFTVAPPDAIDEAAYIDPQDLDRSLCKLAEVKAGNVADRFPESLVLGADTIVVKNGRVFGKPADAGEAGTMLKTLSDSQHRVMTGIALVCRERSFSTTAVAGTDVFFRKIDDNEIDRYLTHHEYRDKAGAYAIQGRAMVFVSSIHGCYYNVVGLPVAETITLFKNYLSSRGNPDGR